MYIFTCCICYAKNVFYIYIHISLIYFQKEILRSLGKPVTTNLYYNFIKQLLERIVPVLLDKESVKYLVSIAEDTVVGNGGSIEAELKLENSAPKGFDLINVRS